MLDTTFENFLNSIRENDIQGVKHLIDVGCDPNVTFDDNGLSPLHLAAWFDRPDVIKFLKERGAKVDYKEKSTNKTALHIAAYFGYLNCCKALLHDSWVDLSDKTFFLPLHYAALQGHLEVVQLLSEDVKDLHRDSLCGTPLDIAIRHQNIEIIVYFLKRFQEAFSDHFNSSATFSFSNLWKKWLLPNNGNPYYFATLVGSDKIISLLLKYRYFQYTADIKGYTPLHLAAEKGYTEIVKLLLNAIEYTEEDDKYFSSPLELAIKNDHKNAINVFVKQGAKPWLIDKQKLIGERPTSTVGAAIWDGNYLKLKEILKREGKQILFELDKKFGDPPLQLAILYRQTEIAKLFIEYGGKELVMQTIESQMTALHRAALHGDVDIYRLIFQITGAEPLKQTCESFGTPLDCALYSDHIEIVEWTLSQPQLNLSFDELFVKERDNWALMDIHPLIGGYFTRMNTLLAIGQ